MKLKGKANKANMKSKGKVKNKKAKGKITTSPGGKKDIADMSVDDMFSMIQDDDSDDMMSSPPEKAHAPDKKKKKKKKKAEENKAKKIKEELDSMGLDGEDSFEEDEEMANASKMSRKDYLKKLKESDPEFYATMMQSDDVLDMKSSDEEDDEDDDDDEVDTKDPSSRLPQDPDSESESEDESDTEVSDPLSRGGNVTATMIAQWEDELKGPSPLNAILEVQQAFLAAIESLSAGKDTIVTSSPYTVKGSQSFNAVVKLCLCHMAPAFRTLFQIKDDKNLPVKSKKWNKYRTSIKLYLRQLIVLTEVVAEPTVAEAVLSRGVLPVIPFYVGHHNLSKLLARRLITLWATSDKKVRVLAFIAIFRLTQIQEDNFLEWILKKMYLSYVQNCRFTSPTTWGIIDFMRVSLVELYSHDYARAYRHAFVYIRQMAIHLRNAILMPKKDRVQLVYNWQYIHCLNLWCELLGKTHPNPALQPMIFPVTQVAIGTMKLQPNPTFYPLAFHICKMLTELSRNTGTFIPVMPFLLEILNKAIVYKQPKKSSLRPFNWMCMLRLSRGEMAESAFKDGVIDQVYDGLVNCLSVESHSIGFPDLVVPTVWQLKAFLKKCRSANYTRKFKQLLEKIQENSTFIEEKRKDAKFGIADTKAIKDWEISVKQSGTPMNKYYDSWRKVREKELQQQIIDSVDAKDYELPVVKKQQLEKHKRKGKGEMDELYSSEEEDDEDRLVGNRNVDEDDTDDSEDDVGPIRKKVKTEVEAVAVADYKDIKLPENCAEDVLKEMNFSDEEDVPKDEY